MAVVPSGNVTVAVDPGSPVPETVNVPFGLAVVAKVGVAGAELSVKVFVVTGEALPDASLSTAETGPVVCGVEDVAE